MKELLKLGVAIGAGIAVWRGKTVLVNASFMAPVKAAAEREGSFIANCDFESHPAAAFELANDEYKTTGDLRLS